MKPNKTPAPKVKIGVLRDEAFSFYYPENLEALERAGAELVSLSPLGDKALPEIDALYAGGGFPEVHASRLASNRPFRQALASKINEGLPVWAECGGLIYLSERIEHEGEHHAMVGALPTTAQQTRRPQGHGYVRARVDRHNPFLPEGTTLKGHEFHYSRLARRDVDTVLAVERGVGIGDGRDGVRVGSVVASYTHIHALGVPEWAVAMVRAAGGEHA